MATAKDKIIKEYENWLRLITLINFGGQHLCRDVLFQRENLPTDGTLLFKILEPLKSKIKFQDQREIICPDTKKTDCSKFDLTLFTNVIANLFKDKYKSLVKDLRDARNTEFHRGNKQLSDNEFKLLWCKTSLMLQGHGLDFQLIKDLEKGNLFSNTKYDHIVKSVEGSIYRFLFL